MGSIDILPSLTTDNARVSISDSTLTTDDGMEIVASCLGAKGELTIKESTLTDANGGPGNSGLIGVGAGGGGIDSSGGNCNGTSGKVEIEETTFDAGGDGQVFIATNFKGKTRVEDCTFIAGDDVIIRTGHKGSCKVKDSDVLLDVGDAGSDFICPEFDA